MAGSPSLCSTWHRDTVIAIATAAVMLTLSDYRSPERVMNVDVSHTVLTVFTPGRHGAQTGCVPHTSESRRVYCFLQQRAACCES